ncbi:MAG: hypothetical protein KME17_22825 [Cyanosarcina radialis HA8281-LM2]|nr:hypothetical protein [Cyanosarcina radialis HA8281-LM2]
MTDCPCCSHQMLRHVRGKQVYWFCRNCWQQMPLLDWEKPDLLSVRPARKFGMQPSTRLLAAS